MPASFVYITAGSQEEAVRVGQVLVEERLVACVNIFDDMTSMYWWNGGVQQDAEAVLIAKTRTELLQTVVERVKAVHSYECPCVISWPLSTGNPDYLQWIEEECRPSPGTED